MDTLYSVGNEVGFIEAGTGQETISKIISAVKNLYGRTVIVPLNGIDEYGNQRQGRAIDMPVIKLNGFSDSKGNYIKSSIKTTRKTV